MSGSDKPPPRTYSPPAGGEGAGKPDVFTRDCTSIRGRAILNPNPEILMHVHVGDMLRLERHISERGPILVALTAQNDVAGVVVADFVAQLMECIVDGDHRYLGRVVTRDRGLCEIEVSWVDS
jgi:hypothetical protein